MWFWDVYTGVNAERIDVSCSCEKDVRLSRKERQLPGNSVDGSMVTMRSVDPKQAFHNLPAIRAPAKATINLHGHTSISS